LRLKPLKTTGYSSYTLVPIGFFIEKHMDDDWASNFLNFFKLPPEEMEKRLREKVERSHAEWQENPEPGLVLRPIVQERLFRQLLAVKDGERGTPLEEFLSFQTDWWEDPVREIQILRNATTQLMEFHPDLAWLVLEQIYRLRPKTNHSFERLKGGMVGVFKHKWQDYRILYIPLPHDVLLICDISRASDLFEPA